MIRTLILSIKLLLLLVSQGVAANPITLNDGNVPIVYCGYILIPGCIDGVYGNFLLDTGTDNLHIDSIFFNENEFAYSDGIKGKIWGIGNSFQEAILVTDTVNFKFNNYNYVTSNILVHFLKPIGGDFIDGLIGLDYFSQKVLEVNYLQQFIGVHESIDSVDVSGYSMLPMEMIEERLCIPLDVQVNEKVAFKGYFMMDLGSHLSTLTSSVAQDYKLDENLKRKVAYYTKYGGIGGASQGYDFIADLLQISDFSLQNVNMSYSSDTSGLMASDEFVGILGNNILDRFDILFDFKNGNLYLKPNANYKEPYVFDRLGFSYADRNKTMGGWIVTGLSKYSPAEKQGLQIDDKIISVNEIPVEKISFKDQDDFLKELDEVKFIIDRAGKYIDIEFKLFPLL